MAQPWSRVVNSTTKNFIKEREVNVLRNRKLTALMKKRGRITFNWSGTAMDWKVQYKRVRPTPYASGDTLDFARKDRHKTATLDWRGYSATDSIEKSEMLMNRGKQQIINLFSNTAEWLMEDLEDYFGEEFYVNGYATGNSKRMHGIESFMSASASAGNGAATPTATNYAGINCTLGAYGGSWDSGSLPGWPNGRGDAHYDFWSPLIVDYGDTLFPGGASNPYWTHNCVEAISFAIIKTKKSKSQTGQLDLIMVDDEMYRLYLAKMRSIQRIDVTRKTDLVQLGFSDVMNQDGVDITSEYGIPVATGYGYNIDKMELRSMQAQVFVPEGPDFDIASKSYRYSIDFFGNIVYNPKFFCKLINLTSPSAPLQAAS